MVQASQWNFCWSITSRSDCRKKTVLVCLSIDENHVIYHSRDEAWEGDEANTALTSKKLMISAQRVTDAWVGMCPFWHEPGSRSLLTFCSLGTLLASAYWMDSYFMYTLKTSRWYICNLHSFSFSFSQRKLVLVIIFITKMQKLRPRGHSANKEARSKTSRSDFKACALP